MRDQEHVRRRLPAWTGGSRVDRVAIDDANRAAFEAAHAFYWLRPGETEDLPSSKLRVVETLHDTIAPWATLYVGPALETMDATSWGRSPGDRYPGSDVEGYANARRAFFSGVWVSSTMSICLAQERYGVAVNVTKIMAHECWHAIDQFLSDAERGEVSKWALRTEELDRSASPYLRDWEERRARAFARWADPHLSGLEADPRYRVRLKRPVKAERIFHAVWCGQVSRRRWLHRTNFYRRWRRFKDVFSVIPRPIGDHLPLG